MTNYFEDRPRWEIVARIVAALIVLLIVAYAIAWGLGYLTPEAPDYMWQP